jgi:hypothetical protein
MAESNVISWTPTNWITISLMVFLTFFIVGTFAKMWAQKKAAASA